MTGVRLSTTKMEKRRLFPFFFAFPEWESITTSNDLKSIKNLINLAFNDAD